MGPARMHIGALLLVLGLCSAETAGSREIKVNDTDGPAAADGADAGATPSTAIVEESEEQEDAGDEDLPILPPIILLDFDNGTAGDNVTDEKSKRTVNNGLGYGFERNTVAAPRKYNYYFPAGKTGTTVSIEESISPFLPRTIIEKVQPSNDQRPADSAFANVKQQDQYPTDGSVAGFQGHYRYYDSTTKAWQPVFGQRTKLTKTSSSEPYHGYVPTRPVVEAAYSNTGYQNGAYRASTTQQTLVYGATEPANFVTPSPQQSYAASGSSRYTYVTPNPPSYAAAETHASQRYLGQENGQRMIKIQGYPGQAQSTSESSTPPSSLDAAVYLEGVQSAGRTGPQGYIRVGSSAAETPAAGSSANIAGYAENAGPPFADLPKYTVENGVRYENKVFWKYPDGRVSDVPPMTYETYSEYPSLAALQAAKSQETSSVYEPASTQSGVLSQGPAQFPMAPESGMPPTPFISADSLSKLSHQQMYRLGYQNLVGQKQIVAQQAKAGSGVSPTYTTASPPLPPRSVVKPSRKNQKSRYSVSSGRPASRYLVNSPNPEYADQYTTESASASTTPASVSSLSAGQNPPKRTSASGKSLNSYSNLQYTDLLSYNPSISQYIKNPASILNVQPTFVQAGNSLIPVIILRVDGVAPIQPKAMPNVNLKALLQQYLIQYANSISELTRPSSYDFGNDQLARDQSAFPASPLRNLARLAPSGSQDPLDHPTESYVGRTSYETSNLDIQKRILSSKYGQRTAARPKMTSVQIVEDPRFPNYKDKN